MTETVETNTTEETLKISALLAELIGTFLLAGAIIYLAGVSAPVGMLGVGFVLVFLVIIFGNISGAHLNPAISIALAINKKVPWMKAIAYIIAQLIGAALALLIFHAIWRANLDANIFRYLSQYGSQMGITTPPTSASDVAAFAKTNNMTVAELGSKIDLGFINATVAKGTEWMTLGTEILGSAIFGLGIGHAFYSENKSMWETGFSVGFGLFAAASLAGSTAIMNPAVALTIGAFETKGSVIWAGYLIYILGTILGMYIGVTAYRYIQKAALSK
ncbi:MIP/aquaporin family protein [Lactovum miscens]|uniref:Glycerol uptake facilitator-like aquaporin n=1 Tax=Lactovum miscens TaxID=190387 RepID=A0A841C7L1_9LACT|nr:aquaporin [Lactovum miscens]MBB5887230.1 glycerol uptake facilitator-like aquaporin [Lactovum miscens]